MTTLASPFEHDVLAAQQGDPLAFSRLVDAYSGVVSSITLAVVRDVAGSEDVAQNVFVAAWNGLGKLRSPGSFLPWLRQLARNQAKEFVRARTRFARRHAPWSDDDALDVADRAANAGDLLIESEEHAALVEALDSLPDETREFVTLFYREGKSILQVADLLGISEAAAKKRLERARNALRDAVLERFATTVRKTTPGATFTATVVAAIVLKSTTAHAATTAKAATAAKKIGSGGAVSKLSATLGTYGIAIASLLGGLVVALGLVGWFAFRTPSAVPTSHTVSTAETAASATSIEPSDHRLAPYRHAVQDRVKRDELRAQLLAAFANPDTQASTRPLTTPRAAANGNPLPVVRGERQANDVDEFGHFVTEAIREDFIPMARTCARELAVRRPEAHGTAFIAFELLGDTKIGGVVNEAEVVRDKSTLVDDAFETCVRESLYGVYFDAPPASTRATLNFEVKVLENADGALDEKVEEFHIKDRRGE